HRALFIAERRIRCAKMAEHVFLLRRVWTAIRFQRLRQPANRSARISASNFQHSKIRKRVSLCEAVVCSSGTRPESLEFGSREFERAGVGVNKPKVTKGFRDAH